MVDDDDNDDGDDDRLLLLLPLLLLPLLMLQMTMMMVMMMVMMMMMMEMILANDEMEGTSDVESDPILRWILIIFFKIISHFKISNTAASAILPFFSFVLGMAVLLSLYAIYIFSMIEFRIIATSTQDHFPKKCV